MLTLSERRVEKRLRYNWPVWFAENFEGMLSQGQMVDVSSSGAAFTCYADTCPYPGQPITTRFSVPQYHMDDSFDLKNFVRSAKVCRVEDIGPYTRRVAVQFATPLSFKPAQTEDQLCETEAVVAGAY